jgi:hypothetical protein
MYYNMTKAEIKQNKLDMVEWLVSRPTWGESWRKYYTGKLITAARLKGGELVEIEKKHMKKRFCFGYGYNGADFDNDQDRAERCSDAIRDNFFWFLEENLQECKRTLKWLYHMNPDCAWKYPIVVTCDRQIFVQDIDKYSCYHGYRDESEVYSRCGADATIRRLTREDIAILIAAYKVQLADIAKRCKTYWKRYGGSKLHTWTYLRD